MPRTLRCRPSCSAVPGTAMSVISFPVARSNRLILTGVLPSNVSLIRCIDRSVKITWLDELPSEVNSVSNRGRPLATTSLNLITPAFVAICCGAALVAGLVVWLWSAAAAAGAADRRRPGRGGG